MKLRPVLIALILLIFTTIIPGLAAPAQAGQTTSLQLVPTPTPRAKALVPQVVTPAVSGPEKFPAGVSPLTGLPVAEPELLALPPALVSVSNFPVSARPQAGLSFAPYVFEMYIGEGMTRYLAMFHGEYPQIVPSVAAGTAAGNTGLQLDQAAIGPIRSGRLPYQTLRSQYNGFLVMASASSEVRTQLSGSSNVYGSDADNINSALIDVTRLATLAEANATSKPVNLTGNLFNSKAPAGGKDAGKLWVFYNYYNQILWEYDAAAGAYLRSQDKADGSGKFYPSTDRLTGETLAFENVVVFFVEHQPLNSAKTLIDLEMGFRRGKAYLFRDGQVYPINWSTVSGEYEKQTGLLRPVRFEDAAGNPFPLKPGHTWVEIVDLSATLAERSPGYWKARFYAP